MIKTYIYFLLSIFGLLIVNGKEINIADVTGGAQLDSLRQIFIRYSLKTGNQVTIKSTSVNRALGDLKQGKINLAIICRQDIPEKFKGRRFPWAAEALVLYVNVAKPEINLSKKEISKLLTEVKPKWTHLSGNLNDIHRIALKTGFPGSNLTRRLLGVKDSSPNILTVRTTSEGAVLTAANPEALFFGRFLPEHSPQITMIKVNGVMPNVITVAEGKYPLTKIYELISNSEFADNELDKLLKSRELYDAIIDSGLLPIGGTQ